MWLILNSSQKLKREMILLESTDTFSNCFSSKKMIAISDVDERLNDFLAKHRTVFWFDIETIELMWKNNRFANDVNRFFERFSSEKNVSSIDDQEFDFWFNDEITDSAIAQIFNIMFFWWSRFDLMI